MYDSYSEPKPRDFQGMSHILWVIQVLSILLKMTKSKNWPNLSLFPGGKISFSFPIPILKSMPKSVNPKKLHRKVWVTWHVLMIQETDKKFFRRLFSTQLYSITSFYQISKALIQSSKNLPPPFFPNHAKFLSQSRQNNFAQPETWHHGRPCVRYEYDTHVLLKPGVKWRATRDSEFQSRSSDVLPVFPVLDLPKKIIISHFSAKKRRIW